MRLAYQYKKQYVLIEDSPDGGYEYTFFDDDFEEIDSGVWMGDEDLDEEEICDGIAEYVDDEEVATMCRNVEKWEEYDGDFEDDGIYELDW